MYPGDFTCEVRGLRYPEEAREIERVRRDLVKRGANPLSRNTYWKARAVVERRNRRGSRRVTSSPSV